MTYDYRIVASRPNDEAAIRLTSEGFGQPVSEQYARDVLGVLDGCSGYQTAIDEEGDVLGYVGYTRYHLMQGNALYLNTVMVDGAHQGRQLARKLINHAIAAEGELSYISFKTQSARMYAAAKAIFGNIFPTMTDDAIPDDLLEVGNEIARLRNSKFPIDKGSYGGKAMYDARPEVASHPEFYDMINFEEGDAVFCVSKVTLL